MVERLEDPVLVYHGRKDRVVSIGQANMLKKAMKKAGKSFEFHIEPGLGHGWWYSRGEYYDVELKAEWYDTVLSFLDRHLKITQRS